MLELQWRRGGVSRLLQWKKRTARLEGFDILSLHSLCDLAMAAGKVGMAVVGDHHQDRRWTVMHKLHC